MTTSEPSAEPAASESSPSTETRPLQLLVELAPCSGAWNMAADEVLLEVALAERQPALRVYAWEQPTVSLGYFQAESDTNDDARLAGLARVRRLSGGGAILHHHEVTYSFVLPADLVPAAGATQLYVLAHEAILEVLEQHGVQAAMRGTERKLASEPFLCFVRGDRHDIVCGGHKIVGSAQRRRRGAVLQHGSILLKGSPHAPEIPGISDLAPTTSLPEAFRLATRIGEAIAGRLGSFTRVDHWPAAWLDRMARLEAERYRSLDWGHRQPSP